jgi:hypothetical protein
VTGKCFFGFGEGERNHPETGGLKPQDPQDVRRAIPGDVHNSLKHYEEEKMKKLLIGFLAVGLIMGFAMTASAQPNIKASGQLYMYGSYDNNPTLLKDGPSHTNVGNRLRMQFEIQIQEGLKLTTRFDALERAWGEVPAVLTAAPSTAPAAGSASYRRFENDISFERAYVTFNALYGVFDVGYQQSRVWGTCAFCDDYDTDAGIHYRYMAGPWTFGLEWEKRAGTNNNMFIGLPVEGQGEGSQQGGTTVGGTDNDHDVYHIYGIYRWATGQAGLRFEVDRDATNGRIAANETALLTYFPYAGGVASEYTYQFYELAPYVQWASGPFSIEAELRYVWGTIDRAVGPDIDRKGWSLYLNPKYTMGAFYGGLEFAYITGDDQNTPDKLEAGVPGGQAWDPLLMYGNYWFTKYHGAMGTGAVSSTYAAGPYEANLLMFKPYAGWKVNPQLEVVLQFAWLKADQKPTGYTDDDYGRELDLYANYKIYNNLTYTVGFGYFWTGNYYKGTDPSLNIDDNYLVMNALNLAF